MLRSLVGSEMCIRDRYLIGRKFKVRTDHAPLTWLRKTPDPIGQQARWLELMEEYDFVVEHRPGKQHVNADALSRRPCPQKNCACRRMTQSSFGGPADAAGHGQFRDVLPRRAGATTTVGQGGTRPHQENSQEVDEVAEAAGTSSSSCLLYTSPSPRDS